MIERIIHVYYGKIITESQYLTHNKTILPKYQFIEWDDNKLLDSKIKLVFMFIFNNNNIVKSIFIN